MMVMHVHRGGGGQRGAARMWGGGGGVGGWGGGGGGGGHMGRVLLLCDGHHTLCMMVMRDGHELHTPCVNNNNNDINININNNATCTAKCSPGCNMASVICRCTVSW